jgi:hypothetical protein
LLSFTAGSLISVRLSGDAMLQRYALQKLHGNECMAVLLANILNGADIGVIQRRRRLSFALKASKRLRIASNIRRQKLQRDEATKTSVLRFVRYAHAPATCLLDNSVVGDHLPEKWGRALHRLVILDAELKASQR